MKDSIIYFQLQKRANEISKKVRTEMGDRGSCVMGYEMFVGGCDQPFVSQPAQGSSTCYHVYKAISEMLIEKGVSEDEIKINHGVMD
jgi:hypothetical protein